MVYPYFRMLAGPMRVPLFTISARLDHISRTDEGNNQCQNTYPSPVAACVAPYGTKPPTLGHSGIESRIPWDLIHDDLPQWRTEDDAEFVATREELEKLTRMFEVGKISQDEFDRRREALFGG